MRLNRPVRVLLALSLLVLGAVAGRAQGTSAVTFPTPTTPSTSISRFVVGYNFTVTAPLTVTSLGFYDFNANGLAVSHEVGIWGVGPIALGQVTVTTGSLLLDSFRYEPITALALVPGITYTMGAFTHTDAQSPGDPFFSQVANVSLAPGFVLGDPQTSQIERDALERPMVPQSSLSPGFFGPGLLIQAVVVPEPTTWAMILGGACTLLGAQRARRHQARVG